MTYTVHTLELRKAITAGGSDGTLCIYEYRSLVAPRDLEPDPQAHLAGGRSIPEIPAGSWFFVRGALDPLPAAAFSARDGTFPAPEEVDEETRKLFRAAAEAVWLESLWRGAEFKNDRILVRILSEDSKTVYQIFREVAG